MAGDLNFKVNFDTQQAGNEVLALLQKFAAGSEAAGDKLNRALGGTTERKLVIRTVRDDQGIKQLKSELVTIRSEADKIKTAFSNATKVEPGSLTSLRQQLNRYTQLRDELSQFDKAIDLTNRKDVISAKQTSQWIEADAKVKQLTASIRNLQDADKGFGGRLVSSFGEFLAVGNKLQDIVTIFQSIGIAVGAVTAPIKAATRALADLDAFSLSFEAIGQSSLTAQSALSEASRIALGLGVSVKTVREGFQQLSPVVLNSGGNMEDVSAITEALSSRFAAFGLSAERSRRVLNGVIQAFSKGKLQAEEFTQQIAESDPAIKGDFAKALFEARSELGALGSQVDGTVANLEGLIKAGAITSEVLLKVIPLLSKSEVLFGKLGPTASTAVEAFKKGNVTLNQVRANFETLNQLNLERFANLAKPIVASFLEIEAVIIDFISTISRLQATQDIIAILNNIIKSLTGFTKLVADATEVLLKLAGIISPIISAISQIPGVIELVGLAIIAKLIKPVKEAINTLKGLSNAISTLAKNNLPDTKAGGSIIDPKQSEVAKRSLDILRAELQKPVESGVKKELGSIATAAQGTDQALEGLTKRQKNRLANLNQLLDESTTKYKQQRQVLDELRQAQASETDPGIITGINDEITKLESNIEKTKTKIKDIYKLIDSVSPTATKGSLQIPISEVNELESLTKSYEKSAIQAYANAQASSDRYVTSLEKERVQLEANRDALKDILDRQRAGGEFKVPGLTKIRDDFEKVSAALDENDKLLSKARGDYLELSKAAIDYSDGLEAFAQKQKVSTEQLKAFRQASIVNSGALQQAQGDLDKLKQKQQLLTDQQKVLNSALSQPQKADQYKLLNDNLKGTKDALRQVESQIKLTQGAVDSFQEKGQALSTVISGIEAEGRGLTGLNNRFRELAGSSNILVSTVGKIGGGILRFSESVIDAIKGIGGSISALSKEIAIFAVIALAISAYSKATEASKEVQEKYRVSLENLTNTVSTLQQGLKDAGAALEPQTINDLIPPVSGLEAVLLELGNGLKFVVDGFKKLFDFAAGFTIDPLTGQIKKFTSENVKMAGIIGTTAVGALAGLVLSGFNPVGAAIGAVAGGLLGLTGGFIANIAAINKAKAGFAETRAQFDAQYQALNKVIDELFKYKTLIDQIKSGQSGAPAATAQVEEAKLIGQAVTGYKNLANGIKQVNEQKNAVTANLRTAVAERNSIAAQINTLKAQKNQTDAVKDSIREKEQELKRAQIAVSELDQTSRQLNASEAALKTRLDELKAAFPQLTDKLILNGNSISNLSEEYKKNRENLENLDPSVLGDEFDTLAQDLGKTRAELEALNERADVNELAGYIEEVKRQLADGTIPNSIENINQLVQALESRSVKLDINAPELPGVIDNLVRAKEQAVSLDGTKATITVEVIEKGLKEGTLKRTPDVINQLKSSYETANKSLEIGSPDFEKNAAKIKELSDLEKAASMDVGETRRQLTEKRFQLEEARASRAFETAKQNLQIEQEIALSNIEARKRAVAAYYDEQISRLQQLGPAEKELADLKKKDLEQQAKKTGKEGLEARAQLERMAREEQIAKLKEQKEKELAMLEQEKFATQQKFQLAEQALVAERKKAEEEIALRREAALQREIQETERLLELRSRGQGDGNTGNNKDAAQAEDIRNQLYNQGAEAKQSFNEGYESIPDVPPTGGTEAATTAGAEDGKAYGAAFGTAVTSDESTQIKYGNPEKAAEDGKIDGEAYNAAVTEVVTESVVEGPNIKPPEEAVTALNELTETLKTINESIVEITNTQQESVKALATELQKTKTTATDAAGAINEIKTSFDSVKKVAEGINTSLSGSLMSTLDTVNTKVLEIAKNMSEAFNKEYNAIVNIKVNKQGLWTGGPTTKGTVYKVNELGQEGFMNKFGSIKPIQKPRFGNWRAPSDGFVIPADIFANINQNTPKIGVKHGNPSANMKNSGSSKTGSKMLSMALTQANNANIANNRLREEIAVSHAAQTLEIGKLTRAVRQLVDKDWNLDVNIKNSNNKTIAYMNTLNRLM